MFDIKEEQKKLHKKHGLYLMKEDRDQIIYVGNDINLKNRVAQNFQNSKNQHPKVRAMVGHIKEFEYIIVDNEIEALILEQNLIKEHKPKYNILLRDDKQYPYIKITYKERFPRVIKTRQVIKDGSKYFGPYPSVFAVNNTLDIIKDLYPIRNCNKKVDSDGTIKRPCLNYHIKKCLGPCQGFIYEEEYMDKIREIDRFFSGKDDKILNYMKSKMELASEEMDFEKAIEYRDKLESLSIVLEKQKIIKDTSIEQDIVGMARGIEEVCIQIFFVRDGKIIGREDFIIEDTFNERKEDILSSFVKQFYMGTAYVPKEIILESEIEDKEAIESLLGEIKGQKVSITIPERGEKVRLVEMVKTNALNMLKRHGENMLRRQRDEKKRCGGVTRNTRFR